MTLDSETMHLLEYQGRRMRAALAERPPNRKEAALIQRRVDDILDRRAQPIAVTPDGEILLDDQSSWVLDQQTVPIAGSTGPLYPMSP